MLYQALYNTEKQALSKTSQCMQPYLDKQWGYFALYNETL